MSITNHKTGVESTFSNITVTSLLPHLPSLLSSHDGHHWNSSYPILNSCHVLYSFLDNAHCIDQKSFYPDRATFDECVSFFKLEQQPHKMRLGCLS